MPDEWAGIGSRNRDRQFRQWRKVKSRSIANFKAVAGDIPIDDITRDQAPSSYRFWLERGLGGTLAHNSANRDMSCIRSICRDVAAILQDTRKWFTIDADEKLRQALNSAIENGLRAAGARRPATSGMPRPGLTIPDQGPGQIPGPGPGLARQSPDHRLCGGIFGRGAEAFGLSPECRRRRISCGHGSGNGFRLL